MDFDSVARLQNSFFEFIYQEDEDLTLDDVIAGQTDEQIGHLFLTALNSSPLLDERIFSTLCTLPNAKSIAHDIIQFLSVRHMRRGVNSGLYTVDEIRLQSVKYERATPEELDMLYTSDSAEPLATELGQIILDDDVDRLDQYFVLHPSMMTETYHGCDFSAMFDLFSNSISLHPLSFAALFSRPRCFRYLLLNAARNSSWIFGNSRLSTLSLSIIGGNDEAREILTKSEEDPADDLFKGAVFANKNYLLDRLHEKYGPPKCIPELLLLAASRNNIGALPRYYQGEWPDTNPLIAASQSGCFEAVQFILGTGFDVDTPDEYDITALNIAARVGSLKMCKLLIDRGACVTSADAWGYSPLMNAVEKGYNPIVDLLIEHGADYDERIPKNSYSQLTMATAVKNMECVTKLTGLQVNLDPPFENPLICSVIDSLPDKMLYFIDQGITLHEYTGLRQSICNAVMTDETLVVLLANGVNPNFVDQSANCDFEHTFQQRLLMKMLGRDV